VLFRVISSYFVSSSKKLIKRVISGYSLESCYFAYFGPFRVNSGYIRVSIGGFVKRVISGFFVSSSKKTFKTCYFGLFT